MKRTKMLNDIEIELTKIVYDNIAKKYADVILKMLEKENLIKEWEKE